MSHVASMIDLFNRRNITLLQDMGYEVHIACNFKEGNVTSNERVEQFRQEMISIGVVCHDVLFPRKVLAITNMVKAYHSLNNLMKKYKYEIVHCQAPISGVITRLATKKYRKQGVKVIYVAHGFHFFKGSPIKSWILYYPVEYICAQFTDCIVTINDEDYHRACGFYRSGKGHVEYIPGVGIDIDKFKGNNNRNEMLRSLSIPENSKVIVTVGELVPGKNHATGLKAFAKANLNNTYYVICGIGRYESELRKLVYNLNIQEKVIFAGYRTDINEINQVSDLFLFPSIREGLPVSVMEAMASGLPVICSNVRGNRDLIIDGKGGYVLDKYDVEGFAKAIVLVLSDEKKIENMRKFNIDRINKYDKKIVDSKMKLIYRSVLL